MNLKKVLLSGLFGGLLILLGLVGPSVVEAGWGPPTRVIDGFRIVVATETVGPTQLLSYTGGSEEVIIYANDNSSCVSNNLLIDDVSADFSTSVTTGTSRIPTDTFFYFGEFQGNLYALSDSTCSITVDIWRKK